MEVKETIRTLMKLNARQDLKAIEKLAELIVS